MKTVFTLSNGKRVDLDKPYDIVDLSLAEFLELLCLVREHNRSLEVA